MKNNILDSLDIIPLYTLSNPVIHRATFILGRERLDNIQARAQLCPPRISWDTDKYGLVMQNVGIVKGQHNLRRTETQIDGQEEHMHSHKDHLPLLSKMSDTDFDIGAFCLHKFTYDFAKLVGIRELSGGRRRREG